jgi:hypothetical protein
LYIYLYVYIYTYLYINDYLKNYVLKLHICIYVYIYNYIDADAWASAWGQKMSAFTGLPDTGSAGTDPADTGLTNTELTGTELTVSTSSNSTDTEHQIEQNKENSEIDSTQVCAYCGFQENFLGSQFVMGQTWHDWEYDQDTNFYQTSASSSTSATPIILNKRGNRVKDDGKLWLPSCPEEAVVERLGTY